MNELSHLNFADYSIIGLYMAIMLIIGFVMMRFNKDAEDYFRGGNMMPFWLAGISLFMSGFSAWAFTGGAGLAYLGGTLAFGLFWANVAAYLVGYKIYAVRWRRTRSLTIVEYLSERYDDKVHQFISWSNLPVAILQSGISLFALGIFISSATNWDIHWIIIISGLVIFVYTMFGGLWAVCMTDTIQFLILMPLALVVLIASLITVGGPVALLQQLPDGFWLPYNEAEHFSKIYVLVMFVSMIYMFNSGGAAQRYFSARDESEAKKIALFALFFCFVGPVIWLLPPIVARVVFPDIAHTAHQMGSLGLNNPREASYVYMCLKLLPHGLLGLFVAGMFAATMASLSTSYNMVAGILTKDIIGTLFLKKASSKKLHHIGQIMTMLLGVLVILTALLYTLYSQGGVFDILIKLTSAFGFPIAIPILYGLIYKKTPPWVPYLVIIVGIIQGVVIGFADLEHVFGYEFPYLMQITVMSIVYFVPGLLYSQKLAASSRDRTYARAILYGGLLFFLAYGFYLYVSLPDGDLMWAQKIIYQLFTNLAWFIISVVFGIILSELISRLKLKPPDAEYLDRIEGFFEKLNTPVDIKKEIGENFNDLQAHHYSMRILGYVMIGIAVCMYFFLFMDMTSAEKWTTLAASSLNLAVGVGLLLLGRKKAEKNNEK